MSYVSFITDEHLLHCIEELYKTYEQSKKEMTLSDFYENKVDPIKFFFDMKFNDLDMDKYIIMEINRKKDKTINNAIGDFHQNIFNGITGYEAPKGCGYDIRKLDNTIFAELKNKHNTMNAASRLSTFHKLKELADKYNEATCYLIEVISLNSQNDLWTFTHHGEKYYHERVRLISADKFYEIATHEATAFRQLCDAIPEATHDFLVSKSLVPEHSPINNNVYEELKQKACSNNVDVLTQIFNDTFLGYNGF